MSHPVLDEIARRAEGRPVYLARAPSVAPWASDEMADLLRRKRPGLGIINGCGLYGSKDTWRARWQLRRPVLWLACFGGQRRLVSRFSVESPTWFATGRRARLFRSAGAEPFFPVLGNLSPFVVRILT